MSETKNCELENSRVCRKIHLVTFPGQRKIINNKSNLGEFLRRSLIRVLGKKRSANRRVVDKNIRKEGFTTTAR